MPVQTRQQRYFADALTNVTAVKARTDLSKKAKDSYGGLCHTLPFLIRNDGLCQAVAWIEDKATEKSESPGEPKPQAQAYQVLRDQIAQLLGLPGGAALIGHVRTANVITYMRDTREILDAWVYYKRFAVSVLGVEASVDANDAPGNGVPA